MTDPTKTPEETPHFETDEVDANLAIEQGLGVGARELAAQRDPGGVVTEDVEPGEEEDDVDGVIERDTSVLGSPDAT
ncbi:hypothetical protein [Brevundimonas sp. NIBR11]|uniref:hypothetical protein n=1 Tax=Brevundimonas sp. NIBR11 TaxID=3015999 RepID=UPI0022F0E758|nr:hypothetical protein [Brevundimonas sp. NIBR11]WGM30300.1 hypothetical protein KKHFBJBL_00516 [Brevundimonas sp. NIBR11]